MASRAVLTYLPTGGRAEAIRLVFAISGVPLEDRRITLEQFRLNQTDHSRFPTEQLPVLEIGGKKYTQAMAILRFAGKLGGLYPFDPTEALAIDEALDHIFEVYASEGQFSRSTRTGSVCSNGGGNAAAAAAAAAAAGVKSNPGSAGPSSPMLTSMIPPAAVSSSPQQQHSSGVAPPPTGNRSPTLEVAGRQYDLTSPEDLLQKCRLCFRRLCELINTNRYASPYIGSARPSIADFAVFVLMRQIKSGALPHVPQNLLDEPEFSLLHGLCDVLESFPGVAYFYETNAQC